VGVDRHRALRRFSLIFRAKRGGHKEMSALPATKTIGVLGMKCAPPLPAWGVGLWP
jgi:hypothetical protein